MYEIIVDSFAGGGGASTGIELAIGRSVDIAINHDPAAIAMHRANHPETKHYCESVWDVDPREVVKGRQVALCWFSPDCKHHSRAKGGKPRDNNVRGLAWVGVRWGATVQPRVIMLENVVEFQEWGPLTADGFPDKKQKGRTFNVFVNALKRQGYKVDWNELTASDYGAPTIRKRFFLIARCDGRPIIWPEPTHGDPESIAVKTGKLNPWHTAAEIIDWSIPCPSIFERKKPLVDKTLRRIARGLWKFIINNPKPFIAPVTWKANDHSGEVVAFLAQYHSETANHEVRGQVLDKPIMTLDTSNRYALVTSHLVKMKGDNIGQPVTNPIQTITAGGLHFGEVRAFLVKYYGTGEGQVLTEPLHTIPTKDRFGLVTIHGQDYQIVDIGMRMLEPHELFAAQGFPSNYIIDRDADGKAYPKSAQVARCGNSVPPPFAEHLVRVNLPELCPGSGSAISFERYKQTAPGQLAFSM
ncbi:DNA cytosine methyltransferase [Fodinisporobacter ferrooxydans]|uniref:DNA (cytosine-5-)-methyltransferase n=1 Tax=Fodinisporobacter ferrooxydans TaxID=2901836 RepID=A0ABY4CJX7_9BACL|nr:DNA cytosine methyltransferase [Alicyclobacillaceae bacterium MYW30-H2]